MDIIWTPQRDAKEIRGENFYMGIKRSRMLQLEITEIEDNNADSAKETIDAPHENRRPDIVAH